MARKKKHPEHANHERWLVSYADFITLLFAFFVVMFAVSQVDSNKVGRFTESFAKAVGLTVLPMPGAGILSGGPTAADSSAHGTSDAMLELDGLHDAFVGIASGNQALQGLQVIQRRSELILRLPEGLFFEAGDSALKHGVSTLKILAPELKSRKIEVRVEGHTDNRPINSGRYRSNWELSTSRATEVALALIAEGLQPGRVSIAGYGEFRPVASNDTVEGRRQNRRVDIVVTMLIPEEPAKAGAGPVAESTAKTEQAPAKADTSPVAESAAKTEQSPAKAGTSPVAESAAKTEQSPKSEATPPKEEHKP